MTDGDWLMDARYYEVEVVLTVSASSVSEVEGALERSGIRQGSLIGEAMVENVTVYGHPDD